MTKDIDTLAKEPTQSYDQRKDQNKVVKIRFGLISQYENSKEICGKAGKFETTSQSYFRSKNLSRLTIRFDQD